MTCYHPLTAYRRSDGSITFCYRGDGDEISLPCGKCVGCLSARTGYWADRCAHEFEFHEFSCFVTLTYAPENLPKFWSLDYTHFQLFMKRLRKRFVPKIRYFMSGEYGEHRSHPHYHAILFGITFPDRVQYSTNAHGDPLYTSKILDDCWGRGMCVFGDATRHSAAYVAKYSQKKVFGRHAYQQYQVVDTLTGECGYRVAEFCHMSLKPGIGRLWFDKFHRDVYPAGKLVRDNGVVKAPPRYYDKLAKRAGYDMSQIKAERELALSSPKARADATPARLAVREEVAISKLLRQSL